MSSINQLKKFQKMYLIRVENFINEFSEEGNVKNLERASELLNAAIKKQKKIDEIENRKKLEI